MTLTKGFLNYPHKENLPLFSKASFFRTKMVSIEGLYANQEFIDSKVLSDKIGGKNLSICYTVKINGKIILIDGHHTVIAKKLNGNKKFRSMFLDLDKQK